MNAAASLLAIETSTEACSVALAVGGAVFERHEIAPREHTRLVLPMVQSVLAEAGLALADIDAFVMGRGPGAFTGVRIAVGVVQGLAFSVDRPVVPVSSLATVAQGVMEAGATHVAVAFDARMDEVYWGAFVRDAAGVADLVGPEAVLPPDAVSLPQPGPWVGAGSGFAAYSERLSGRLGLREGYAQRLPRARDALVLGRRAWRAGAAVDAAQAQPVYIRDRVVQNRS
ncbi:tRNA (adenosine(37)-N6)-threonylcarbamoyltransferase complex dimerization subunit type 1 TsaB [Acidihalobacter ferrooxydans]|uniref:tRNA threonylcarbamoyladenosine biosynthesis protein TsaB n=1 Tax=Acidihalobacter ferrooxydans TaxID=1765967 RepID=A0A1P8UHZ5_9GAMM|nr:tRNA (adenosine(37)-N6)-threonylcarbamoyltransferase complex dimerization subunit type 1 TsaB [Acidihalobacter ferrooxydans]APZ43448.1 tRNA (adenosine(37)-N6)-threonylcarbamoyltransferase complex dimerization subunit type 1 TsaB [Acidihalobacter ferrooxydans]